MAKLWRFSRYSRVLRITSLSGGYRGTTWVDRIHPLGDGIGIQEIFPALEFHLADQTAFA